MKLWCCVGGKVKHLVDYQLKVDNGKLTAIANLEKLTFRALALRRSKASLFYYGTFNTNLLW